MPFAHDIQPFRFDGEEEKWEATTKIEAGDAGEESQNPIRIVTYNVWFEDQPFAISHRYPTLLSILAERNADIICLQEVTPVFLQILVSQAWVKQGYWLSGVNAKTIGRYGVIIMTRFAPQRLQLIPSPVSNMGRSFLVCDFRCSSRSCRIVTSHLESLQHSADTREQQLHQLIDISNTDQAGLTIFCGDTNFCSPNEDGPLLEAGWRDLWPDVHPGVPGETIGKNYPSRWPAARFDRFYTLSCDLETPYVVHQLELLGTDEVEPKCLDSRRRAVFPSDHAGLALTLSYLGNAE
jgi:endonuclease/exonuclease/phosphatase family metal-dependent hydrolase